MENYTTGTGQKLKVHTRSVCHALKRGLKTCVIHARADTHMKDWPTNWRTSWGGFMEVICPHGVGHPAPEETRPGGFGHGCDGCCSTPAQKAPASGNYRYKPGGLMRCCLVTLADFHDMPEGAKMAPVPEGHGLACRFCQTKMVLRDGGWEWDKSRAPVHGVPIPPEAEQAA